MSEADPASSAVVLGFDGVPWGLLREWVEAGELPNFATLFEEGTVGPLESTTPPTTPLAWPSIATGVYPDKHGFYGFNRLTAEYTHRVNTSDRLGEPPLWELLSPSAVGNVPMTYPAGNLDGRMVAGMMAPKIDERSTHPPELAEEIRESIPGYRIGLKWNRYRNDREAFREDLESLIAARRELMRLLSGEDWRLFFFVFTAPDRLQHLVWEEGVLLEYYRTFDDILGEVMTDVVGEDCNLFVVSDHGFGPISQFVHVNTFLERRGFLARKRSAGGRRVLDKLGLTKSTVLYTLEQVGLDQETLVRYLPATVVDSVADHIPGEHSLHDVDFTRTTAFLDGPGNVYVNDTERFDAGIVPPSERTEVKTELVSALSQWTGPDSSEPVLEVHDGASLFASDPEAPDVVVNGRPGYQVRKSLSSEPLEDTGGVAAYHRSEGILLAWGRDIDAGRRLAGASVVDIAPTLLHSLDEPVSRRRDGRVIEEIFDPESPPATRPVATADYGTSGAGEEAVEGEAVDEDGEGDREEVEERLRGLGYLE